MQPILTTYSGETDGRSFSASVLDTASTLDSTAAQTETFGAGPSSTTSSSASARSTAGSGGGSSGSSSTPSPSPAAKKSSNTGAIAGGVVGGVAGLALIGAGIFFLLRHQRKNNGMQGGVPAAGGAPATGPGGAPLAGAAVAGAAAGGVAGAGAAGSPGMSQVNTPPPQPYYADPSKTPEYAYAYAGQGSPQPGQQPYFQGQPQPYPPQQPYYAANAVGPSPERTDSTSPLPVGSSVQDYRMSSVSAAGSSPYTGPISPQTTGNTAVGVVPGGHPQVPATIHEAGGNAVGGAQDFNANHHGEMHELA